MMPSKAALYVLSLLSSFAPAALAAPAADDPAVVGKWNPTLIKTEVLPIHVVQLPNGKILYWDRHDQGTHDIIPRVWDPATNTTVKTPNPGFDLFCAGHAQLRTGDVLIAGGHVADFIGEDKLRIYNWRTNTWDAGLPVMNDKRWYPSVTPLPNGDALITSGTTTGENVWNEVPQVYESRTRTLRSLTDARLAVQFYPFMYVVGKDRLLMAGPDSLTRFLDVGGTGKWTTVGFTRLKQIRNYGSAIRYAPGKIMICGGAKFPPTASAEIIDANAAAPAWTYSDSMHYGRRQHTAVQLPDGKVIVTGGTSGPGFNNATGAVYNAEMWDPATGHWTVLAPASTIRLYHSFSLLLPDGRLLTGGGGHPGDDVNFLDEHPNFEIYEPPYLFRGTRPAIDSVTDTIYYGKSFHVKSKNQGAIRASLMRLAAVTHARDHDADFNWLPVQREGATDLLVAAPEDSVLTAPGPHYLYLLDSAGIPSVGKLVWLASPSGASAVKGGSNRSNASASFAVSGNRLRLVGIESGADATCRLIDTRGNRVAELKRIPTGEFRLPRLRSGAYIVELIAAGGNRIGKVFIP
jgi:hypothetical protein